jgi:hypothetical protein
MNPFTAPGQNTMGNIASISGIEQPKDYQGMSFEQLDADIIARPVLWRIIFEYLKNKDRQYFEKTYTGKINSEGYPELRSGGHTNTTLSQSIGIIGDEARLNVIQMTKDELDKLKK